MKRKRLKLAFTGTLLIVAFAVWTVLIQTVDVQCIGVNGTEVGFATVNSLLKSKIGVDMTLYSITDWLGLVPVAICFIFGIYGFVQLIKRKSLLKVDSDILISGIYYAVVAVFYLIFEMNPINYRPILINGIMEASYPSSTTLLVLCVMPTLVYNINRRTESIILNKFVFILTVLFTAFMVIGRLISGVHWVTDIIGSVLLSTGMFNIFRALLYKD